ncbi:hypothetical protein ID866_4540 [Astraeus odoratus]|nr:hypothetical protein ID866_4540 [Astraeus odoratus]
MQGLFYHPVHWGSQKLHAALCNRSASSSSLIRLHRKTNAYAKVARVVTDDPIWTAIPRLRWENNDPQIHETLVKCGISHQEFLLWKPAVFSPSLGVALDMLAVRRHICQPDVQNTVPAWVLLALASHKVRTPASAQDDLLKLTFGNLTTLETQYRPALLVLATHSLAHFGIIAPMRRVLDSFLLYTTQLYPFHFNTLLQALSSFAKSEEVANLALTILETMTARQIPLWLNTYRFLMTNRFVTLQLTKYLRARMIHEGVVPRADHLEAYLRIFSRHGAIHEAREYLKAIREYCIEHSLTPPYGPLPGDGSNLQTEGSAHPADTLYLRSVQNDRASAFHYLHNLLRLESLQHREGTLPQKTITTRSRCAIAPPIFRGASKHSIDIYDWTTALVSATNDRKTTASTLLRLFENARTRTKTFCPTIVTYTVLLRGLLWRKAYKEALKIWNQLMDSGLSLDRKALTVGVQVLTRAGHPQEAFCLLHSFADNHPCEAKTDPFLTRSLNTLILPHGSHKPSSKALLSTTSVGPPSPLMPTDSLHRWINIVVVNEFLVSLLRLRRPDIVFIIWDNLELLYGILPDDVTLNILLKSAVLAVKMDRETVKGSMAHFALQAPFVPSWSVPGHKGSGYTRAQVTRDIMQALERPEPPAVVGIWRGECATEVARRIFRNMLIGNWPRLRDVETPVTALRSSTKEGAPIAPIVQLAKSLVDGLSHKAAPAKAAQQTDLGGKSHVSLVDYQNDQLGGILGRGAIPSVHPSTDTFLAYIKLLGLSSSSYTHEIPLVLAWMRCLRIPPTRQMLSIALVLWAEVGLRGPIFEEWAEKGGYSEYGRLEKWIEEWVQQEEAWHVEKPTGEDITKALWAVAKMRDRYFGRKDISGHFSFGR